jgi:MoaA/NifB/PqqE/SkfB family radical SAM enzyme
MKVPRRLLSLTKRRIGFFKRTVTGWWYRRHGNLSSWPTEVLFFLTYKCNLRCQTCGQWGERGYVQRLSLLADEELPVKTYSPLLSELASFRPQIILCGGEIFLYPNWREFIEEATKYGLKITIITNGTRLIKAAPDLVKLEVCRLIVSLDGPEEVHDRLRGVEGVFQQAIDGIKTLQAEKDRMKSKWPVIDFNTVISPESYSTLPEVIKIARSLAVRAVTFLHLNFVDEKTWECHQEVFSRKVGSLSPAWDGFVRDLTDFDTRELIKVVKDLRGNKEDLRVIFLPDLAAEEIENYYQAGPFTPRSYPNRCLGPWKTVNILPTGDVSPCLGYSVGNIREETFGEIWNGAKMQHFRRVVMGEAPFPVCSRCCTYYRF